MTFENVRNELRGLNIRTMPKVVAMALQDELPQEWRILIYKYGQTRVFGIIVSGLDLKQAIQILAR